MRGFALVLRGRGVQAKAVFPSLCTDRGVGEIQHLIRIPDPGTETGGLSSSGSDQAHEGRLVNALAIRGDEGRGTLR
jgi:hypothetical protein